MIQQRKLSITRLSHHHPHRSFDNEHKYPSMKKRRSQIVIHVTIGLPKTFHSMNNNLHSVSNKEKNMSLTQNQISVHSINIRKSNGNTKKSDNLTKQSSLQTSHLSRSSKVTHHESIITGHKQNENEISDRAGITNNYHRKSKRTEKKKCSRRCFIAALFTTVLIVLIIGAILLALLIKPKTTTTTPPNSIPVLRWNTTGFTVAGVVNISGSANNQLNNPYDVILDYANNLYIADLGNNRIQKYLFGSSVGETVAGNITAGSSQYQLNGPSRVILDSNENLYVLDTYCHRVQFWRNGAIYGKTVAGTTNSPGNANTQLNSPYGIALNPTSDTLYIADYVNHRIMSYESGINNGTLVLGGIGPGYSNTHLYYPTGLRFDAFTNSLIIANIIANNVVRYVLGANGWTLVAGDINGSPGVTSARLKYPVDMTFDPMGNIYVVDRENHRIQLFYDGQLNGTTIAGITGVNSNNATTLNWPWSVKLDSQLNLYVADTFNHRIQKFLRY